LEGLDEKLTDLRHGFESTPAKRVGVDGNAAPADDAQALGIGRRFDGGASFVNDGSGKKRESDGKEFGEVDSLFLRASAEEGLRKRSEQTGAVAAGSVSVNTATVGEAL
jgi:hypothetical protein